MDEPTCEKAVVYYLHMNGGPNDGAVCISHRPYYQIACREGNYRARSDDPGEYIQWVDDWTRRVDLYFEYV